MEKEQVMTTDESWRFYSEYMKQQRRVLAHNLDTKAFEYGLQRFTSLKRITFTPATHGITFMPLYRTPMIRTLPYGFNYELPRGWPVSDNIGIMFPNQWNTEADKVPWRGFREAIRQLADEKGPSVTDLVLDVNQLLTGLTCHFFDKPCKELDHLMTVLKRPGFRRLDLSLMVGAPCYGGWDKFCNGYLRRALAEASGDLEHIFLRTDVWESVNALGQRKSDGYVDAFIPLRTIFPIEKWPKLQHFGLSRFLVRQDDIVSFLLALPKTIRTIELSFLFFLEGGGCYRDLLEDMRNTLDWQSRYVAERPKVIIGLKLSDSSVGTAVWLEEELESFFYDGGKNPFQHDNERVSPNELLEGGGGTVRNAFEPGKERPFVDRATLIRLGFVKKEIK
ncbi:hypothetical protein TrVFT333_006616 [Trichoderma virens FT-333]|nr:hypothetical protein TrVFT333_006616 [Trichoderma virens FT-333]